jgi:hypothetical protein
MLSVALPWAIEADAAAAADAAEDWRQVTNPNPSLTPHPSSSPDPSPSPSPNQAVDDLAQAGLQPACNRWSYAASREGRAQLASLLSDEAASRFLLEE